MTVQKNHHLARGNTIIEVMISVLIIGTILTALASSMTYSVKNTSEAQYRDYATSLANEPIEVLRYERATKNWNSFYSSLPKSGNWYITTLVFGGVDSLSATAATVTTNGVAFTRKLEIVKDADPNKVTVTSEVTWSRNGQVKSDVTLEQVFYNTNPR